MATAKKTAAKTTATKRPPVKKVPAKKVVAKKINTKAKNADGGEGAEDLEWLEIKKPVAKKAVKRPALDIKPVKVKAKTVGTGKKAKVVKATKLAATGLINEIVARTELTRKDVKRVLDTMGDIVKGAIMPGGVGGVVVPGIGAVLRKAIKARKIPAIARGTVVEKRNMQTKEVTRWKHPGRKASVKPATAKARVIIASATRRAVFGTA